MVGANLEALCFGSQPALTSIGKKVNNRDNRVSTDNQIQKLHLFQRAFDKYNSDFIFCTIALRLKISPFVGSQSL